MTGNEAYAQHTWTMLEEAFLAPTINFSVFLHFRLHPLIIREIMLAVIRVTS